jgi:hypothetical protein
MSNKAIVFIFALVDSIGQGNRKKLPQFGILPNPSKIPLLEFFYNRNNITFLFFKNDKVLRFCCR